ncbi:MULTISPECIES: FadR/GntR family transcriptional regulator [Thalassotalea]|uniref:FadR/GntR family transcriptional regulator n=1 Tax=Thalassotalea castellviae TaxID=3075612 RepID=A0ABU3A2F1_9GAMM|nr:FadR/GntR family transcriptional regulator [Thalassotalea sp. W431]MDT0604359.1 FadR/GntR family transcriptional regulator [Thalassotalea sp. W431]
MHARHLNLTQQLVHELGRAILKGKYKVGDKLPSEAELGEIYDISRNATREAVKMLTAKGLINSRPRKGIQVVEKNKWNLFDTDVLGWILVGKPDLYMLRHFLQLRQPVEAQAAFLAAHYATNEDYESIEHALSNMQLAEVNNDAEATHHSDVEFHKAILNATQNPFFIQLENFIETALQVNLRYTNRINPVTEREYQAHADLFASIKNGDATKAYNFAMKTQSATLALVDQAIKKFEANQ